MWVKGAMGVGDLVGVMAVVKLGVCAEGLVIWMTDASEATKEFEHRPALLQLRDSELTQAPSTTLLAQPLRDTTFTTNPKATPIQPPNSTHTTYTYGSTTLTTNPPHAEHRVFVGVVCEVWVRWVRCLVWGLRGCV